MDEDRTRWDCRYADVESQSVVPSPPDGVEAVPDVLPTEGRALDLACGLGAQSVWAAQRGLQVDALDVSQVAIDCVERVARRFACDERIRALVADLDDLDRLAELVAEAYELIVCQRFRSPTLYPFIVDRLAPGGVAVVTVLSCVGASDAGPYHAPAGELSTAFDVAGVDTLVDTEGAGQATVVVRRRPARPDRDSPDRDS